MPAKSSTRACATEGAIDLGITMKSAMLPRSPACPVLHADRLRRHLSIQITEHVANGLTDNAIGIRGHRRAANPDGPDGFVGQDNFASVLLANYRRRHHGSVP